MVYLSTNQSQVSRKGFAVQQNNPLFFKDSKIFLSCGHIPNREKLHALRTYPFYEASPLTYTTIDKNGTAFLVVWGTDDDIVEPRSQSEVFVTALKQAGFFVRTVIVPGAPHFWIREPLDEPTSYTGVVAPRLVRFLQARL